MKGGGWEVERRAGGGQSVVTDEAILQWGS